MNFDDTPEEAKFRSEVRAFLEKHAPKYSIKADQELSFEEELRLGREFQALKAEAGYAKIIWPKELGGLGGTAMQWVIYNQEEEKFNFPVHFFMIGLGVCMAVMRHFASEEHKQRFIPPALRGDDIWCQIFSEPAAGSDLAGIRLKAEKDGDDWVLNGQKVWTSWAEFADYGVILTRTDPTVPKHKGLTFFFLDLKSPGVEVRPITQMSGKSKFCEIFFNDVRVPDSQRLGDVNAGWSVALTALAEERVAITGEPTGGGPSIMQTMAYFRDTASGQCDVMQDPAVREQIADFFCEEQGLRNIYSRLLTKLSKGEVPGPESAVSKLVIGKKLQDSSAWAMSAGDFASTIMRDEKIATRANDFRLAWLESPGRRISGGTDEILRNTLAERVLGMPGDIRADKGVPFKDL